METLSPCFSLCLSLSRLSAELACCLVKICVRVCEEVLCLLSGPLGSGQLLCVCPDPSVFALPPRAPADGGLACVCERRRLSGATGLTQ